VRLPLLFVDLPEPVTGVRVGCAANLVLDPPLSDALRARREELLPDRIVADEIVAAELRLQDHRQDASLPE